ncbi:hypothetical protein JCM5353_005279, partial [Sporobolomyces roseus]
TKEVDYDTYLSLLQDKITARQTKLQSIRLRERRANALFVTYGIAIWAFYVVLWYFGIVGSRRLAGHNWQKITGSLPVISGPVVIVFTRRFMRWFYHRKEEKEELIIKSLMKKKADKVEEIKKKTGYYSTRDLLEKYDEALRKNAETRGSLPGTPIRQTGGKPGVGNLPVSASTPARLASASGPSTPQQHARSATTNSPVQAGVPFPSSPAQLPFQPSAGPPLPPSLPQSRSVMDKLADALLGVSPEESNPYNKYALICASCFAHNGLVPKDQFNFVQYRCPHCGHFNPRKRDPSKNSLSDPSHRRVQSMHAPSPLRSIPQSSGDESFSSSDGMPEMSDIERKGEEDEEDERERETLLDEGGSGSSATRRSGEPARRRTARAARGEEDEDKMETED